VRQAYPESEPEESGMLDVGDGHGIYCARDWRASHVRTRPGDPPDPRDDAGHTRGPAMTAALVAATDRFAHPHR
jgi:hypothetical protein